MRFYSVVSRKTLWNNKTAAVAKNNTLSAKYRTSKIYLLLVVRCCLFHLDSRFLSLFRKLNNNCMKCMYSQRFVCAKVHFGNKIYICNIFRTCADDQTIRPCFQISKYTHSFYTVTVFRLLSLGYQNIIPIICTSAIATAIQLHASNFNEPTHVERSDFFLFWNWNRTTRSHRI